MNMRGNVGRVPARGRYRGGRKAQHRKRGRSRAPDAVARAQLHEFYPTPAYATEALLARERFEGQVWECACGQGHISTVLAAHGYSVTSTDLHYRGFGVGGVDFLGELREVDCIVTNPPYSRSLEFVLHAKRCARRKVAMLLRTLFLESARRHALFADTDFPLQTVYQFSKRLTLAPGTVEAGNGGMVAYAWFVWSKDHVGPATIRWIP